MLMSCSDERDTSSAIEAADRVNGNATTLDTKMDVPLAPPPYEWEIEVEERDSSDSLIELLWSIYDRYIQGQTAHPQPLENSDSEEQHDGQAGCLDCGRETGFLPTPDILLESVTSLEHKATSYVTLIWESVMGADSYRVFLIQVDEGQGDVSISSTTDVHTSSAGLGLDHGYAYIIYVIAYHRETKRYSVPSEPIMMRCSLSYGCALLTETMAE